MPVEGVDLTRWEFEDHLEEAGFAAFFGPRTAAQLAGAVDVALDIE